MVRIVMAEKELPWNLIGLDVVFLVLQGRLVLLFVQEVDLVDVDAGTFRFDGLLDCADDVV